jgi:hypothetical protein
LIVNEEPGTSGKVIPDARTGPLVKEAISLLHSQLNIMLVPTEEMHSEVWFALIREKPIGSAYECIANNKKNRRMPTLRNSKMNLYLCFMLIKFS